MLHRAVVPLPISFPAYEQFQPYGFSRHPVSPGTGRHRSETTSPASFRAECTGVPSPSPGHDSCVFQQPKPACNDSALPPLPRLIRAPLFSSSAG